MKFFEKLPLSVIEKNKEAKLASLTDEEKDLLNLAFK